MYIWDPYGQNLGIYPIRVLHGPHICFFAHMTYIGPTLVNFDQQPYGQIRGIYPIWVLLGPHIGFFAHIRPL